MKSQPHEDQQEEHSGGVAVSAKGWNSAAAWRAQRTCRKKKERGVVSGEIKEVHRGQRFRN